MTTPNMKPGLNFGGGPGGGPNPFRLTFFIVGIVFLILGLSGSPVYLSCGIVFVILSFIIQDGDGKGPRDGGSWSREQMDQSDSDGNPRPPYGSDNS